MKLMEVKTRVSGSCRAIGAYIHWLSLQHDTQLVSLMYRTHKSLPASCKISSLYVFDALSRAARQQVLKHNFPERHGSGNCATFLLKVAGVLEGLFQDMLVIGTTEAKVRSLESTAKNSTGISRKITNSPLSLLSVSRRPVMSCFNLIIEHILRTAPLYLCRFEVVAVLISFHRKKPKRFMTSGSKELLFRRIFSVAYRI